MNQRQPRRQSIAPELLAPQLRHIRWIGGGSGAGKTTVARALAAGYGQRYYSCDEVISAHAGRSNPADDPQLHAFLAMSMDERWVNRSPAEMYATFSWFQGEGFDLILEDLLALPRESPIVAEGFRLLPRLVAPLLSLPNQAVWLIPSAEFRRAAFDSRGFTWKIPRKTSNPERALSNLLARDQLFTDTVLEQAAALHLRMMEVDGTLSVAELTRHVGESLSLVEQ